MNSKADLHLHTTASDGSFEPAKLVQRAAEKGLKAIAITDHDTINGIEEALNEAEKLNIEFLPGIELGTDFTPEMHILGYFKKENYKNIKGILGQLVEFRNERNKKMIEKLNELGFNISEDEVKEEAGDSHIYGRVHMAQVMFNKGYVKNFDSAFKKYLGDGKKAYISKGRISPEEAITDITKAGGISVLAHPVHLNMKFKKLDILLSELVPAGLKGMETYYVDNTNDDTGNLIRLADKYGIIKTGGSDFHGKFKNGIDVGSGRGNLVIPYECYKSVYDLLYNDL